MPKLKHDGIASEDQIDVLFYFEEIDSQPKYDDAVQNENIEILKKINPQEITKKRR